MYTITEFDGVTMICFVTENNEARWFTSDPDNCDFQAYERWLDAGNQPEQWQPERVNE